MTRKAFIQKYFWRFAVSLTLLSLIVYTVYHVFWNTSGSLMRDYVRKRTDVQLVSGEAYLFREESVLTVSTAGVVNDLAESGSKVGKDVTLAEVWRGYTADEIERSQTQLDMLNRMISVLENSLVSADTTLSKAELYRTEATKSHLAIRQAVTGGDWSNMQALEDDMLAFLNRYAMLTGATDDIPDLLESMEKERTALLRGDFTTLKNSQSSGYFYNRTYVDGYESIFTPSALEALTAEIFAELISSEPESADGFAVGKMVYGNRWYLAIGFDATAKELFEEAVPYSFTFPENGDRELKMTCTRILQGEDGSIVAVFSSDEVPSDFTYLRAQNVEITVGDCTGYDVPETALHTVNGVEGVYIFEDSAVYFRRVEVLYRGDGYCIVAEQGDRGDEYLGLHDIIVTSGENLYDGKVYR